MTMSATATSSRSFLPSFRVGRALVWHVATWFGIFLIDLLMLSTFEAPTARKVANLFLGLMLNSLVGYLLWRLLLANDNSVRASYRIMLLGLVGCIAGGAVVGAIMRPVENWAKLADMALGGLPPAGFAGLWFFYALMLLIWGVCAVAVFFQERANRAELQRAEFAAAARAAELGVLRLQINPHFLFNSLASLRALVQIDPGAARSAIDDLALMMRYSLERAGAPTISLEEELTMVEAYLKMEKLRLAGRLRLVSSIETGIGHARIPPLSLQTLVENAVKFGAANRRAGGEIRYEAGRRDGRLVLRVFNPGSCSAPSDSTRQGLVNLRRRLDVLYGREAGLELRQGEPDLVIAELFVPFETSAR